jgi:hypothetical protein
VAAADALAAAATTTTPTTPTRPVWVLLMKVGLSLGMRFINGSLMAHAATVADDGSDDVEVTGVTGDSINRLGWASVCTMVDCRRPSNLTCEFYDEQGRCSTDTICCYECATGEGHSAACDATAADAEDDGSSDGGSTAGDDMYAPVGNTNEDIDAFFVSMAAQVRDLVLESHGAPAPEP